MNESSANPRPNRWPRWLKRLGWCVVWLVTLVALLVVFENWRGRRAWERFVAKLEASGESLDPNTVIPATIPDDQNFAMTSLFKPLFNYSRGDGMTAATQWHDSNGKKRADSIRPMTGAKTPSSVSWRQGKFVDLPAWQQHYRTETNFPSSPKPQSPGQDVLFALGKFDPELNELRTAAARPAARFPLHYEENIGMLMAHLTSIKGIAQLTEMRALAQLSLNQTEEAHQDLALGFRLSEALDNEPTLISQLVRIASFEISMAALWEGLARHQWTEQHLTALDSQLARINFAASYQLAIRGERLLFGYPAVDEVRKKPELLDSIMDSEFSPTESAAAALRFAPSGWLDQNKVAMGRVYLAAKTHADPATGRFYPQRVRQSAEEVEKTITHGFLPHTALARILVPALTGVSEKFARAQSTVDLARVAIALERHRLKHGALPATLDALDAVVKPTGGVPRDVITGDPLHYQPNADGRFQLYSTGWNGTDDGGKVVWADAKQTRVDFSKGDWVWPMPEK